MEERQHALIYAMGKMYSELLGGLEEPKSNVPDTATLWPKPTFAVLQSTTILRKCFDTFRANLDRNAFAPFFYW